MPVPTRVAGHSSAWQTWLAVVRRAAFYTLPFLVIEVRVFDLELVPWAMFLAFLPVAFYRVTRGSLTQPPSSKLADR